MFKVERKNAWRRRGLAVAAVLMSVAVSVLVLEVALRCCWPQRLLRRHPGVWLPDASGFGHRMAPNLDRVVNTGERDVRLVTDENGFRVSGDGASQAAIEVLALGDSFLEALSVPFEGTMTELIGEHLSRELGEPVRVVNTGLSGADPNHYLLRLSRQGNVRPPDAVLVFFYLGNDVIDEKVDVFPVREPTPKVPFRWPKSLRLSEFKRAWASPMLLWLRENSHLTVLVRDNVGVLAKRFGLAPVEAPMDVMRSEVRNERWSWTAQVCGEIGEEAEQLGAPVLFVLIPTDFQVDARLARALARNSRLEEREIDVDQPATIVGRGLRSEGLPVIDLTEVLRREFADGVEVFGKVDHHLGPEGHEVVARVVGPELVILMESMAATGDPTGVP